MLLPCQAVPTRGHLAPASGCDVEIGDEGRINVVLTVRTWATSGLSGTRGHHCTPIVSSANIQRFPSYSSFNFVFSGSGMWPEKADSIDSIDDAIKEGSKHPVPGSELLKTKLDCAYHC